MTAWRKIKYAPQEIRARRLEMASCRAKQNAERRNGGVPSLSRRVNVKILSALQEMGSGLGRKFAWRESTAAIIFFSVKMDAMKWTVKKHIGAKISSQRTIFSRAKAPS